MHIDNTSSINLKLAHEHCDTYLRQIVDNKSYMNIGLYFLLSKFLIMNIRRGANNHFSMAIRVYFFLWGLIVDIPFELCLKNLKEMKDVDHGIHIKRSI